MKNKTALITGSSRGIGKIVSKRLEEEGIITLTPSRKELDLRSNVSINNYLTSLDVPIDILINNAGIQRSGPFTKFTEEDFHELLQINLVAPFKLVTGVIEGMKSRNYGRILNISSIWGIVSKEDRVLYSTSKSGLNGLTRSIALEVASYNILVNALAPGYVNTEMTMENNNETDLAMITQNIPLKRIAEVSEISECIVFLCSEKNSYITGQVIVIDGGYSIR